MPENDQPMWPSSDEDRSSSGGGKTTPMSLPDRAEKPSDGPGVRNVTAGSWFKPNVPPEPIPGVNAPAEPPAPAPRSPKETLAERLAKPAWDDRSTQQMPVKPVEVKWAPEQLRSARQETENAWPKEEPPGEPAAPEEQQAEQPSNSEEDQRPDPVADDAPEPSEDEQQARETDQPRESPEQSGDRPESGPQEPDQGGDEPGQGGEEPGEKESRAQEADQPSPDEEQAAEEPSAPVDEQAHEEERGDQPESPQPAEPEAERTQYVKAVEPPADQPGKARTEAADDRPERSQKDEPEAERTQYVKAVEPRESAGEQTQYVQATDPPPWAKRDSETTQWFGVPVRPDDPRQPVEPPTPEQWREEQLQRRAHQQRLAEQQERQDAPWAQRIDVPETQPGERRPELPEPPRGTIPDASAGSLARPMRVEPDGRRFDAETTVGIERQFPGVFHQQPQPRTPDGETLPPPREPSQPEPAPAEEPPKKRGKGKWIALAAVVVLLLAGAGVAAAMPKVANRLELPWAPNAPKGDSPEPAAAMRSLQGPDAVGKAPSPNGVKNMLAGPAGNGALGQFTGSVVDPVTGTVLWDHSATKPVLPASTTKVLTSAAALLSLDPNTRLSTKIVQGADPGTVILVGGGDTTLTALPLGTDSPLYPGAAHVDDLVAQVKKAAPGVKKVQVDLSLFKGPTTAAGWAAGDAPSTFATQIASVMADSGRQDPKNNNSQRIPNAGSALAGTIASKLGASPGGQATAAKDAKVLAEVKSAPLTQLVSDTMELSDDVLAEALARQVALANGEEASFAGGAAATLKVLKAHGFDTTGLVLSDGSGISMQNRIPASLLTQVLAAAAAPEGKHPDTAKLRPLLAGLPVAGGSGTLADKRFDTPASQPGKGWVRAKTGTLTGVNTLAGLVLDQDGRVLVFAFMSSGSDVDAGRDALDVVAASLRKCGCG